MTERNADLAAAIARLHGIEPVEVIALTGGFVNHTFAVGPAAARFVVRFAVDPLRRDDFDIETWCLATAASAGIVAPALRARGELHGVPYSVQEFVDGTPGSDSPADGTWRQLGALASRVSRLPLSPDAPDELFSRFGRDLPRAWAAHVDYNRNELGGNDPLVTLGVYAAEHQNTLRRALGSLRSAPLSFGLRHGDLAPRNVIVRSDGTPALLDWGAASAGPAPWGDLQAVYRWHVTEGNPSLDQVRIFAEKCGIGWPEALPTLEAMLLLEALDLMRWALEWRTDQVAEYRAAATTAVRRYLERAPDCADA